MKSMIFILPIKYFTRYVLQTCYAHENYHFLTYSAKNPAKIPFFYYFFSEKVIFANFPVYFQCIQISEGVTSYEVQWYSFWYQWIGEVHTYTLVVNIGVSGVPYRKSREGVATTRSGGRVTKNISGGRGLNGSQNTGTSTV